MGVCRGWGMRRKAQGKERMDLNTTRQRQRKPRTLCSSEVPVQLEDHVRPDCLGQCDVVIPLLDVLFQSIRHSDHSEDHPSNLLLFTQHLRARHAQGCPESILPQAARGGSILALGKDRSH